jgi:hypothetical protein
MRGVSTPSQANINFMLNRDDWSDSQGLAETFIPVA